MQCLAMRLTTTSGIASETAHPDLLPGGRGEGAGSAGLLALAFILCLSPRLAPAQAGAQPDVTAGIPLYGALFPFPYDIQPEPGVTEFAPGDNITIGSLRGNRPHLEPGGRYLLEGTYTLASAESAELAWFTTSRGASASTPVEDTQQVKVSRGAGKFRLVRTLQDDGWSHLSFYVNHSSSGGVYFGEKGNEAAVLRKINWSHPPSTPPGQTSAPRSAATDNGAAVFSAPANLAIMAYLGDPVPAPAGLAAKYYPTNLAAAFNALSKKNGWEVRRLAVDETEFPFLVYGVLAGQHDFRTIEVALRQGTDYAYGGSVVSRTDEGATYFSLNLIPSDQLPSAHALACHRRLMIRLQMLADAAQDREGTKKTQNPNSEGSL